MRDFSSLDAYTNSDFYKSLPKHSPKRSDRVLHSLRIDDAIYKDARAPVEDSFAEIERSGMDKLPIMDSLTRDVFQSFYSLQPSIKPDAELSPFARKISSRILDETMRSEDYALIKSICEGKAYPAMEATVEFMERISNRLEELMDSANGKNGAMNTLVKQEKAQDARLEDLNQMDTERQNSLLPNPAQEKKMLQTANCAAGKIQQLTAISQIVDDNLQKNRDVVEAIIDGAIISAKRTADETQSIILSWGTGAGELEYMPENRELVNLVRNNLFLCKIARYLGRLKEMLRNKRKNSFAFGRGEKYSLEYGNDLKSVISSEFSMLASPDTIPLFLRKHSKKMLKQYRRRERIYKGSGDIICCLDESFSTRGENAAWGKAVALALQDIAQHDKRNFALVHFSSSHELRTDVFRPG